MAAESSSKGNRKGVMNVDVGDLLKKLKLHDAELDDVFLGKEEVGSLPTVKWMAAGKLLTRKVFSPEHVKNTMLTAWSPAQEVSMRGVGTNIFTIQARCLGDWKRITEDGPWPFRGFALMIEPFDGSTPVPVVAPNRVQAWIQIHKIPPLYRTKEVITQLASRVGEVVAVEMMAVPTGSGDFHRVRVKLDPLKPLTRFTPLSPEGQECMYLQVKFEKLPRYCEHCGLMGHEYLQCGSGEFDESELQFGLWMKADEASWRPGTSGMRLCNMERQSGMAGRGPGGARGGRSQGRGAGGERVVRRWQAKENVGTAKKRSLAEAGLGGTSEDLDDTATSPLKKTAKSSGEDGQNIEPNAKKHLDMDDEVRTEEVNPVPPPPPGYTTPSELKKQKKKATLVSSGKMEGKNKMTTEELADSLEEDRHQQ
ncbi:hypothetical protein ACQ4PT_050782 [Festuca glaucescens]